MDQVARIEQDPCGLCHDPIVVYDDLRIDDDGRPAAWLYHVECYACGQVLQLQPVQPVEESPA